MYNDVPPFFVRKYWALIGQHFNIHASAAMTNIRLCKNA